MLTIIVGPMKSGKTNELIAQITPYNDTDKRVLMVQSVKNVRDNSVKSRIGLSMPAQKVTSLREVKDFDVVGIDEVHMFDESDVVIIDQWLDSGKDVIISGLDIDYSRRFIPIVSGIFSLKPHKIISRISVCDVCHDYSAQFTQILCKGDPVTGGLPSVVPEDGTYTYEARCRKCFVKPKATK